MPESVDAGEAVEVLVAGVVFEVIDIFGNVTDEETECGGAFVELSGGVSAGGGELGRSGIG